MVSSTRLRVPLCWLLGITRSDPAGTSFYRSARSQRAHHLCCLSFHAINCTNCSSRANALSPNAGDFRSLSETPTDQLPAEHARHTVKRRVALHVGYIGTGYQGLQSQTGNDDIDTTEAVLFQAVHAAGGILSSNLGTFHRLGVSRSSRTDKGVHSLATVIGMKMECPSDNFHNDPEGIALATAINCHLPPQICVFSVQKVNRVFNARKLAHTRTYRYYLPTSVLGSQDDLPQAVQRFRDCLALFCGKWAFHNFTQRSRYRSGSRQTRYGWRLHAKAGQGSRTVQQAENGPSASDRTPCTSSSGLDEHALHSNGVGQHTNQSPRGLSTLSTAHGPEGSPGSSADGDLDDDDDDEALDDPDQYQETMATARRHWSSFTHPRQVGIRWMDVINKEDRVQQPHYRAIDGASVEEQGPLVPGGADCLHICFKGDSFMLHQIRHMVGAAVAVARGIIPVAFVRAALSAPARTDFPLAPAQVLVLADCTFHAFPTGGLAGTAVTAVTGPRLSLKAAGTAQQEAFCSRVLRPELDQLMQGEVWEQWQHNLARLVYPTEDVEALVDKHAAWRQRLLAAKKERTDAAVSTSQTADV